MEVHLTRVDLVVVGSLAADVAPIVADYERRLSRYVRLEVHELKAEPGRLGVDAVVRAEGARMGELVERLERAAGGQPSTICALDLRGDQPTSEQLAERWLGQRHLIVCIGGTHGLAPELLERASMRLAFGRVTLPHQLARVVATEQLYRAFRIARGEPYHF